MIALLDTDVLIDVALDRDPYSTYSSLLLDEAQRRSFDSYVAWHSISNLYYVVKPIKRGVGARGFIRDLLRFVRVAPTTTKDAINATTLKIADLEDALQVAAASCCKAEFIVTRNIRHFKESPVPSRTPKNFLQDLRLLK